MAQKAQKSTKKKKQELFIKAYAENLGHIGKACEFVKIGRRTYYNWCDKR